MERILETINAEYVSLPSDETHLNNAILQELLKQIIDGCKENQLFRDIYTGIFYGGSFYDGLKIDRPDEYDINVKLRVPYHGCIKQSNKEGFVNLKFSQQPRPTDPSQYSQTDRRKKRPYYGKRGLNVLIDDDDYLNTDKVMIWMHQILSTWLKGYKMGRKRISKMHILDETFKVTLERRGPSFIFRARLDDIFIKFDLVPCFEFRNDQWPIGFRCNPFPNDQSGFFIVPKPYVDHKKHERYLRMSFPVQERLIIDSKYNLKPALRLLKKLRDKWQHHEIKSYYIKTIILQKSQQITIQGSDHFWNQPLSSVFMEVLKDYQRCIACQRIPYFWSQKNNLIREIEVDKKKLRKINMDLKYIIDDIETNVNDKYLVAKYLLSRRQFSDFMERHGDTFN